MNKNILFMSGAGESPIVYRFLWQLKRQGCRLYLISDIDTGPPVGLFENDFRVDLTKILPTFDFVVNLGIHFDAVITRNMDPITPLIAMLTKHFGGIGNDPRTAFHTRSKYHMRKIMRAAGIPGPRFALCKNFADLRKAVLEIGIPCVAKPVGWHSSFGTFMLKDIKELANLEENYYTSLEFMLGQPTANCRFIKEELDLIGVDDEVDMVTDYIVEEFLDGPEITVDAIVQDKKVNILGMEEQIIMEPPYFVRLGGMMPFECPASEMEVIVDLLGRVTEALGIENSPTHTELILTRDGPRLVEIACRSGSDNLHDSIYHLTGRSMVYETAMVALGVPRDYDVSTTGHIATEYLLPEKRGILSEILVPDGFKFDPDIVDLKINAEIGSLVAPPPKDFDYLGYISVKGNSREEARQKLRESISRIKMMITDDVKLTPIQA